jgi:lysophospholipase L1-like esterase
MILGILKFIFAVGIIFGIMLNFSGCGDGAKGDTNYTALGASDTFGVGATPLTNGYAYLVEEGIEQRTGTKVDLDNLGIPGAEVGDIDNLEAKLLSVTSPDLISLSTGANDLIDGDSIEGFESDLNGLLGKLRSSSPHAIILISNIPDLTKIKRFIESPNQNVTKERLVGFNNAIARLTASCNAHLVDLFNIPLNDDLVSDADGFHPNDRGHRTIADAMIKILAPLLPFTMTMTGLT